jgi:hypothetical protein
LVLFQDYEENLVVIVIVKVFQSYGKNVL